MPNAWRATYAGRPRRSRSFDITNPFFTTLARGVEDVARGQGFSVVLCLFRRVRGRGDQAYRLALAKQIDGVLLVRQRMAQRCLARAAPGARDYRWSCSIAASWAGSVDTVRGDSEQGAYLLVQHLLELGHTQIAVLSGPIAMSTAADRVAGYSRAMRTGRFDADHDLIYFGEFSLIRAIGLAQQILMLDPRRPRSSPRIT
ncbi:MAG: substrate-binding domain-containing protein [Kouleothrix sp.]